MTDLLSGTDPVPTHKRSIDLEVFDRGPDLVVVGRIRDRRPWAEPDVDIELVHDLELRVAIRVEDLLIIEAQALMHTFPHAECPAIESAFGSLVGLNVARGYTRQVQERLAGVKGCSHLEHLARAMGPAVFQAVASRRARAAARGEVDDQFFEVGATPWTLNTCHVWAEGGPAQRKLEAGWQPGVDDYPAAPVEVYLRSRRPPEAGSTPDPTAGPDA